MPPQNPFPHSVPMFPLRNNDTFNSKSQLSRIAPLEIFLAGILLAVSLLLYKEELYVSAVIAIGILALLLCIRYPAWAIALCITTLALDYVVAPEREGMNSFMSPFRLLQLLVLAVNYPFLLIRMVFIRGHDQLASKNIILFFLLFAAFSCCTLLWSPDTMRGLTIFAKLLIQLAFFHLALHTFRSKNDITCLIFFNVVITAATAYYAVFIGGESVLRVDDEEKRMALVGVGINTFAGILGLALISYFVFCRMSKSTALKILLFPSIPLITFAILKCGTRSVFVGIPLSVILISIAVYWKRIVGLTFWFLGGCAICLMLFFLAVHSGIIGDQIVDRLFSVNTGEFGNARANIWKTGVINYLYSPRGTGLGGEYLFVEEALVGEAHNTFISVLLQTSLIGFILFTIPICDVWRKVWKIPDQQMRFCALLIYFSVLIQASRASLITNRFFWFYLIITCLYIEVSAQGSPNKPFNDNNHIERSN